MEDPAGNEASYDCEHPKKGLQVYLKREQDWNFKNLSGPGKPLYLSKSSDNTIVAYKCGRDAREPRRRSTTSIFLPREGGTSQKQ